jgi:hypothetical protein
MVWIIKGASRFLICGIKICWHLLATGEIYCGHKKSEVIVVSKKYHTLDYCVVIHQLLEKLYSCPPNHLLSGQTFSYCPGSTESAFVYSPYFFYHTVLFWCLQISKFFNFSQLNLNGDKSSLGAIF